MGTEDKDETSGGNENDKDETSELDLDEPITKENFDPERWEKTKAKLREEARNGTKKQQDQLREYEAKIAEFEKAGLSEKEKLERERDEARSDAETARAELRKRDTRDYFAEIADKLKFRNPKMAWKLVDDEDVELDEDDRITNAEALLKKLAKDDPYLVKGSGNINGGDGGDDDPKDNDMNRRIRKAAGR